MGESRQSHVWSGVFLSSFDGVRETSGLGFHEETRHQAAPAPVVPGGKPRHAER